VLVERTSPLGCDAGCSTSDNGAAFGPRLLLLYSPLFDLPADSNSDIVTRASNHDDHRDKRALLTRWPSARLKSVGFRES
jgi:hypothetical protein